MDDDPAIRRVLASVLLPPEFDAHTFGDPRDALAKLNQLRPDVIVCDVKMPPMDGRAFLQIVQESKDFEDVPFLFLSAMQASEAIVAAMDAGADDYVSKPFDPMRLVAKVRAMLRRRARTSGGGDALGGALTDSGALPLIRFCEDRRLTGKLVIERSGGGHAWAEFEGGDMVRSGLVPEEPDPDPLDVLVALKSGRWRIEQRRLESEELQRALDSLPALPVAPHRPEERAVGLPAGHLSVVTVPGGEELQVQTECENKPNFTVTTVIVRSGRLVKKIEKSWDQPFAPADVGPATEMARQQHLRVEATIRSLASRGAGLGGEATQDEDARRTLATAVTFLAEAVRSILGSGTARALLRRNQARLLPTHPALAAFGVADNGRVEPVGRAIPRSEAAPAVAQWVRAFLADAGGLADPLSKIDLRATTRMIEADLDQLGFFKAVRPGE